MTASDPRPAVDPALVDFAVQIAREAGTLTLRYFRRTDLDVESKGDGTPVTVADREAERLLRDRIAEAFPDDSVVGEEEPDVAGTSDRTWVLDPIDGTQSFIHGVPLYANLVALEDNYGPAVGVINVPGLDECVWAGRGRGCFVDGDPARVGNRADLRGACVVTSGVDYWRRDPNLGRRVRLRPGGYRSGRRHGRPGREPMGRGSHADHLPGSRGPVLRPVRNSYRRRWRRPGRQPSSGPPGTGPRRPYLITDGPPRLRPATAHPQKPEPRSPDQPGRRGRPAARPSRPARPSPAPGVGRPVTTPRWWPLRPPPQPPDVQ